MRDYLLSEIKNANLSELTDCVELTHIHFLIKDCNIEPRDMIELPCKEHFTYTHDNGHITENWRVFYRGQFALIETAFFSTEQDADEFLAKLKG